MENQELEHHKDNTKSYIVPSYGSELVYVELCKNGCNTCRCVEVSTYSHNQRLLHVVWPIETNAWSDEY